MNADRSHLQPPPPARYRGPTVVEPRWTIAAAARAAFAPRLAETLAAELCAAYGARHCLLLDRARSGLYLLVDGLNLRGRWLMPSIMHRPTAVLLKQQTAGVTLADCDEHFNLCPDATARHWPAATVGMLATHTYGKVAQIEALRRLADERKAFLVENAVHAAPWQHVGGRPVGSFGDATILSFNVDKPLGALLGGALLTNRDDVWAAVSQRALAAPSPREVRNRLTTTWAAYRLKPALLRAPFIGRRFRGAADGVGEIMSFSAQDYRHYTPRGMHFVQAAAAKASLGSLRAALARRSEAAQRLTGLLAGVAGLGLPLDTAQAPHGFLYYPVVLPRGVERFGIGQQLAAAGFETKWRYHPLHLQPDLVLDTAGTLARSEDLWRRHLCLPLGYRPDSAHLPAMAAALRQALGAAAPG